MLVRRAWQSLYRAASNLNRKNLSSIQVTRLVTVLFQNFAKSIGNRGLKYPLYSLLGFTSTAKVMNDNGGNKADIIRKADELFELGKFGELDKQLKLAPNWQEDADLLWRVGRSSFQLSKTEPDASRKKELVKTGYDHVVRSLELNQESGCAHKWAAILLDASSSIDGTKARITQALNIRKHMEEAIRLLPEDGTSHYLLGEWHYSLYNISWLDRKVASVIFATVPEGSLDKALEMFDKAEQVNPGFYSKNLVMLSKTLLALKKDQAKAKECLLAVIEKFSNSEKWDDKEAVEESKKLLKSQFNVKV
ncbi:Regulator of microtubule dynamics protein 1 [Halotydeus destructor]|nr:Regulator of microtubule dynamics protein 1 [Halotydeus destructor]